MKDTDRLDWLGAWTGQQRAVHIGNVAEFNEQFYQRARPESAGSAQRRERVRRAHRYAGLALFYSPHPAVVLLPGRLDTRLQQLLHDVLQWDAVEIYRDLNEQHDDAISDAILKRPTLLQRLMPSVGPVIAWGHTMAFHRVFREVVRAEATGAAAVVASERRLSATRRYESKLEANTLLARAALGDDAIRVPRQWHFNSVRAALSCGVDRARSGDTVVLKTPYGAGGSGVFLLSSAAIAAVGGARALRSQLRAQLEAAGEDEVFLEEFVPGRGPFRDITVDAIIAADATVHPVGVGVMRLEGTAYAGVTVGPGAVPERWARPARRFVMAVGHELAAAGYRGWFDIDLVTDPNGTLWPTEINCRVTGPAAAFCLAARLDQTRGRAHLVSIWDHRPLRARISDDLLYAHLLDLRRICSALGVEVVPTLASSAYASSPSVGLALAATDSASLDMANTLVKAANAKLGRLVEVSLVKRRHSARVPRTRVDADVLAAQPDE